MSLEGISRGFAYQHGILLNERRNGVIGRKDRLVVGFWDNGVRQDLFANRNLSLPNGIYESKVRITDDGQNPVLNIKILYGCLEDYIIPLDKIKNGLCRTVQKVLIEAYRQKSQPPEAIFEQKLPLNIPEHYPDLWRLLKSFYPPE